MTTLTSFADDAVSVSIGKLTIENRTDRLAIYGSLDLTRDRHGLALARTLKAVLDEAVQMLVAQKDLAAKVAPAVVKTVKNRLRRAVLQQAGLGLVSV